jgi:hypothetical protein
MAVHDLPPPLSHFEENAPLLLSRIHAWLIGDVVAVLDDDRNLREQHEIRLRHSDGAQRSAAKGHWRRHISLREREVEARLEGDDGADISVLDGCAPAKPAAL